MKKLLISMVIASLALTGLAGCSSTGNTNEGEGDATAEKVVIEIGVESSYKEYYEEVTKAYTEKNPNVTFKISETGMFDLLDSLEAQRGNSADVFMIPNDRVGDLAQKKLITALDVDLSEYTETAQTAVEFEGQKYFLPLSTDTTLLLYNKALTTEVPSTLKEIDPNDWSAKLTDFYVAAGLFYSNGSYIFGDSTDDIGLNNDAAIKAGEAIQSLYSSKVAHWEALKEEEAGYNQQSDNFAKGQLKYVIDGPWKIADFVKAGLAEENIGVAVIPSWDGTEAYKPLTGTKGLAVNAYSDVKDEAVKFVASLANTDDATKWYQMTKEVNPNTNVVYEEGSVAQVVLEATKQGTSMPTDPSFGKCWTPMADALKQIASGGDVKESLNAAVEIIKNDIAAMKSN